MCERCFRSADLWTVWYKFAVWELQVRVSLPSSHPIDPALNCSISLLALSRMNTLHLWVSSFTIFLMIGNTFYIIKKFKILLLKKLEYFFYLDYVCNFYVFSWIRLFPIITFFSVKFSNILKSMIGACRDDISWILPLSYCIFSFIPLKRVHIIFFLGYCAIGLILFNLKVCNFFVTLSQHCKRFNWHLIMKNDNISVLVK